MQLPNSKVVGSDYPYLIVNSSEPPYRAKRLNHLLEETIDSVKISLEQMKQIQIEQISSHTLEVLIYLRCLYGLIESENKALMLLKESTGGLSRNSRADVVYEAWLHHFER